MIIEAAGGRRLEVQAVERAIFAMVAYRMSVRSLSKLAGCGRVAERAFIEGLAEVSDDACYRAMDFLHAGLPELQKRVFFQVASLLDLEVDLLFFDTSSTYWETSRLPYERRNEDDEPEPEPDQEPVLTESGRRRYSKHSDTSNLCIVCCIDYASRMDRLSEFLPAGPPISEAQQIGCGAFIGSVEERLRCGDVPIFADARRVGKTSVARASLARIEGAGGTIAEVNLAAHGKDHLGAASALATELAGGLGRQARRSGRPRGVCAEPATGKLRDPTARPCWR